MSQVEWIRLVNFNPESTLGSMGGGLSEEEVERPDETDGSGNSSQASGVSPPEGDAPQIVITQQPHATASVPSGCGFGAPRGEGSTSKAEVRKARTPRETPVQDVESGAGERLASITPAERRWVDATVAKIGQVKLAPEGTARWARLDEL